MSRAHRFARFTRALSVAMPVFAYICRYSFEISTKARRDRSVARAPGALPDAAKTVEPIPHRLRTRANLVGRHHRVGRVDLGPVLPAGSASGA